MSTKPLAGVRVADFTWVWAGPFCTEQLAHLGAEVIRVETAARQCVTRMLPPFAEFQPGPNRSGYFNQYNQGKQSLTLNLKHPRGLEVARRLVARSDVVAENFANGVMERMGLGYEEVRRLKPDAIMLSISGYGRSGPEREFVSYGPATVPLAGFSSVTGYKGGPPMHIGVSYGDPTAGLHGALAVMAALCHRRRTGEGQFIDVSLWEAAASLLPDALLEYQMNGQEPPRDGNRDPHMAPHGVFRCAGADRWLSVAVRTDEEWQSLCAAMEDAALGADPRFATLADRKCNEDALEERITAWTQTRSAEDATRCLQAAGVAAFPAMTNQDLYEDPHLNERGFFVDIPHPEVGARHHAGIPWRLSATPCAVEAPAPCVGEHNRRVLAEVLGYSEAEIDRLTTEGALG
ncbi:MAG TPA: CoA transferase [Candidatus Binatia bacterium]|nr:CoA transferase [Candidatus Binatia bacterium]